MQPLTSHKRSSSLSLSLSVRVFFVLILLVSFPGAAPASIVSAAARDEAGQTQAAGSTELDTVAPNPRQRSGQALAGRIAEDVEPPLLRVVAEPVQITSGEVITYSVAITNVAVSPLTRVVLSSTLPAGVEFVPDSAAGFVYSARDRLLTWTAAPIQPGTSLQGGFQLRASDVVIGDVVTTTVTAASPGLMQVVSSDAVFEVGPPAGNSIWLTPGESGWLRSDDRRVDLRLPRQAVSRRTRIDYSRPVDQPPLPEHIFYAFSLEGVDENGTPVSQFQQPLTLSTFFDPRQLPPDLLSRLSLFHLNETSGEWEVVPSRVDLARRRVAAQVEHFSKYGFGYNEDYMEFIVERMSALRGAQTNLFTLSVGYSYAMQLPPGQGGLTPLLALNYSSANHTPASGHHSLVGFGWDLLGADSVYIPPGDANQGKITLSLQGRTYSLRLGADGWYAVEDPFLQITASNLPPDTPQAWSVRTQDGTEYTFDAGDEMGTYYWKNCGTGDQGKRYVRIPLRRIEDTSGNAVNLTWQVEAESAVLPNCPSYRRATRLGQIDYNNNMVRITLAYNEEGDRLDSPEGYNHADWRFFTKKQLIGVTIEARDLGDGDWRTVRSYALGQSAGGAAAASQRVLNLDWIEERSAGGSPLPRTDFTYSDNAFANQNAFGALINVTNGYGGQVAFISDHRGGSEVNAHIVSTRTEAYGVTDLGDQTWTYAGGDWSEDQNDELAKGFERVDVTRPDGALEKHEFHGIETISGQPSDHLAGREKALSIWSGGTEVARTVTTWEASTGSLPVTPAPNAPEHIVPRHVRPASVEIYEAGTGLVRTDYLYEPGNQGGTQWGNLTRASEYVRDGTGWSSSPVRTTYSWYYPNTEDHITSRIARTDLYEGCAPPDSGCDGEIASQTLFYYDQIASYTTPPTQGRLRQRRDGLSPLVQFTKYEYWPNGNLRKVIDGNNRATETFYDWGFKAFPVCVVNALGQATKSYYYGVPGPGSQPGSPCSNQPAGSSMVTSGAFFGLVEQATDANGAVTSFSYDQWGRLTDVWRPGDAGHGATERYVYTNYGGAAAPFKVQARQREDAGGATPAAYLDSYTFYDGFGRIIQTQAEAAAANSSIVASTRYNGLDQVVKQNVPFTYAGAPGTYRTPNWTDQSTQPFSETAYDALGRVVQATNPDGSTRHTWRQYTGANREIALVDEARHQEISELDAFGRLERTRQYMVTLSGTAPSWGAAVYADATYQYDAADRLVEVTSPAGGVTTIEYDDLGRKESMNDPDMGAWSYTYDAVGNLKRQTDARGQTICFYYDALNRLIGKHGRSDTSCPTWNGGALSPLLARYYYDEAGYGSNKGRRTRAVAYRDGVANNTMSWSYDGRGRTIRETLTITPTGFTAPLVYQTDWAFDAADRVLTTIYPDVSGAREVVTTTYNTQGLPVSLTSDTGGDYVSATTYDALGRLITQTLGNNNFIRHNYWAWNQTPGSGRLEHIFVHDTALETTAFLDLAYHYDAAGNVRRIIDTTNAGQQECFVYDALNRLTRGFTNHNSDSACSAPNAGVGAGPYDESYAYDAAGRMTAKGDLAYAYDSAQPVHAPQSVADVTFTYDAAGNLLSGRQDDYNSPAYSYSQEWNAENRLAAVETQIGATTIASAFGYDGDGRRVWKQRLDTTNVYPGVHLEYVRTPALPVGVNVDWFEATEEEDHNLLTWITIDESHTVGYNVYRSDDPSELGQRLNANVIPAQYFGQVQGDTYTFQDYDAPQGEPVWYWLEELTDEPGTLTHGPVTPGGGPAVAQRDSSAGAPETVYHDIYNSYYYLGGQRVALRRKSSTLPLDTLMYLLPDHLGTVRLETYGDGPNAGDMRAATPTTPYGGVRTVEPVSHHWFTGQHFDRSEDLYDYGARPYDPLLGLFIQPDSIVPDPGDPQLLNRYSYVRNSPLNYVDPTGHDLMIVGGNGGDLDIAIWQQWIVEYKGWSLEQWNKFHAIWNAAQDLDAKNVVLAAEGIGVFNWGGTTWTEADTNAHSETTISMIDELASQMAGMKDVTLIGWSKGGNLVLQYLWAQEQGRLNNAVIPVRAVLLAPGTHPAGPILGASWVRNEVPGGWPATVNICSHGDRACPLTIRNAVWNINPPWKGNFHGPHGRFAASVIDALNVAGHHQARPRLPE